MVADRLRGQLDERRRRLAELRQRFEAIAQHAEAEGLEARTAAALSELAERLNRLSEQVDAATREASSESQGEVATSPSESDQTTVEPARRPVTSSAEAECADMAEARGTRPAGTPPLRWFVKRTAVRLGSTYGLGMGALAGLALLGDLNLAVVVGVGTAIAVLPVAAVKWWHSRVKVRKAWEAEQAEFAEQMAAAGDLLDQRIADPLSELDRVVDDLDADLRALERWRATWSQVASEERATAEPAAESSGEPRQRPVPATRPSSESAIAEQADLRPVKRRRLDGLWREA